MEIRSISPERATLTITGTDYRSLFMQPESIDAHGGDVVAQVRSWLHEEAAAPAWRAQVERSRHGELF